MTSIFHVPEICLLTLNKNGSNIQMNEHNFMLFFMPMLPRHRHAIDTRPKSCQYIRKRE